MDTVDFAKALADETRQKIMALCCCKTLSVNEIVEALAGVTQPTVSHHLKILREAGLVIVVRKGKEIYYTLNQAKLAQACCNVAGTFAPNVEVQITKTE